MGRTVGQVECDIELEVDFWPCGAFDYQLRRDFFVCNGSIIYGCIYTDQLWVDMKYRQQGFGKQLMDVVHKYGRKMDCKFATVNTMSFQQAQKFYEKLGYHVDFERKGYSHNSNCLMMKKKL